ncbi:hypothetical protein TIFTF001_003223 [Ficus carica]|uniref:Uncharacterized protein n=1 Tax=Ficus carica TaxID=3494 RepID=A0AA87ZC70_FICCA|nr:hypothetical protein TIFTF001_003223 [Ficus carica]
MLISRSPLSRSLHPHKDGIATGVAFSWSSGFSSSQPEPTLWLTRQSNTNTLTGCSDVQLSDVAHSKKID